MFEQLFPHRATVARYRQSPFAAERQLYLSRLMEEGRSLQTLRNIAWILMYVARHLPLDQAEITPQEIEAAAADVGHDHSPIYHLSSYRQEGVRVPCDELGATTRSTAGTGSEAPVCRRDRRIPPVCS